MQPSFCPGLEHLPTTVALSNHMGWLLYFKIETKEERKKGSVIRKSRDAGKTGGMSILILQVKNLMLKNSEGICSSLPKFTKLENGTAKTENWVLWMPKLLYSMAKSYNSVCKQTTMR